MLTDFDFVLNMAVDGFILSQIWQFSVGFYPKYGNLLRKVIIFEVRNKPLERDVYYFKNEDGYEADFVVCKGDKVEEVYQVSYDLTKEKTRAREIRGLLTASKHTRCENLFLITDVERTEFEQEGKLIKIIPAYEWLIQ